MSKLVSFAVYGIPIAKQSFRFRFDGNHFIARNAANWEKNISYSAIDAMRGRKPFVGLFCVRMDFYLPNRCRRDLDNLSKGVLDGMKKIVFDDDTQVWFLTLEKHIDKLNPRVEIVVEKYGK